MAKKTIDCGCVKIKIADIAGFQITAHNKPVPIDSSRHEYDRAECEVTFKDGSRLVLNGQGSMLFAIAAMRGDIGEL